MRSILTALQEGRLFELPDAGKDRALEFLARILDANPDIEVGTDAIEEIKQREQECNTGIGLGVAVPARPRPARGRRTLLRHRLVPARHRLRRRRRRSPSTSSSCITFPARRRMFTSRRSPAWSRPSRAAAASSPSPTPTNLNVVRNLLLDWVSAGLGEAGPEAVARMIKLEVKQAQVPVAPPPSLPAPGRYTHVLPFSVVVSGPNALVLSSDGDFLDALEKNPGLVPLLTEGRPFNVAGRQVFLTSSTRYAAGRVVHQCVALSELSTPAPSAPRNA